MFYVSPSVFIYNASDQSGVLVFVPALGKVVTLTSKVGFVLLALKSEESFDFTTFNSRIVEIESAQVKEVWHTLISEGILIEEI
ncbi:MAG: hypothetical protein ABJJ44_16125 [Paraglaciecola sp.]|uniref:hypothetical protein n=1 Tax=Paraglaciecola sp. TaxID=1920173 RepID=UPI00329A1A75